MDQNLTKSEKIVVELTAAVEMAQNIPGRPSPPAKEIVNRDFELFFELEEQLQDFDVEV